MQYSGRLHNDSLRHKGNAHHFRKKPEKRKKEARIAKLLGKLSHLNWVVAFRKSKVLSKWEKQNAGAGELNVRDTVKCFAWKAFTSVFHTLNTLFLKHIRSKKPSRRSLESVGNKGIKGTLRKKKATQKTKFIFCPCIHCGRA